MSNLIAVSEIIKMAVERGINLGKGDPYNRLRYYTKIGWLPHMVRKVGPEGDIEGHYPVWVLDRLELIEKLKSEGNSNDDIEDLLKTEDAKVNFNSIFSFVNSPAKRNQLIMYLSFLFIFVILLSELGVISGGDKKRTLNTLSNNNFVLEGSILDSGSGFFAGGDKLLFVSSPVVTATSKVYVTFMDDYSPATRFWVRSVVPLEGFYIELDTQTDSNANFNWWVSN